MARVAKAALQDSLTVLLGASENDFVDLAIGIFRHDCASGTIGSHRAATMADGEIAAGQAVFVLNQVFRPLDEILSAPTGFQHPREVGLAKDITEKVFRIAGNPAVALSDRPFCVHRNELIGTVLFPDAG